MKLFASLPKAESLILAPEDCTPAAEELAERREHASLARKLGVGRMATTRPNLLPRALVECSINVYPLAKVEDWLDRKAKKADGSWGWFALREKDILDGANIKRQTMPPRIGFGRAHFECYKEMIPLPVLVTVDRLVGECGDDVRFFVACFTEDPDPFLGCMSMCDDKHTMYVIERWDEPGFRS